MRGFCRRVPRFNGCSAALLQMRTEPSAAMWSSRPAEAPRKSSRRRRRPRPASSIAHWATLCTQSLCRLLSDSGQLYYVDAQHLSNEGASYALDRLGLADLLGGDQARVWPAPRTTHL
jgi:hypothetical protein